MYVTEKCVMIALITCLILQSVYIRAATGTKFIEKFTRQPLNGYHCDIDYYANVKNILRHRCTELCIKDSQCWVLSYNAQNMYCLMGSEPCPSVVAHQHFSLMVFREKEDEYCVSWIQPLNNPVNWPRLVETLPGRNTGFPGAVGRMKIGQNIHLGHILQPRWARPGYFPIGGKEVSEPRNYELLSVSPSCSLA